MADQTTFLVGLFILLAAAVLMGELVARLGQAALVGQLLVGVVLGPTLLGPFLGLGTLSPELGGIQFLATFFILVSAGLEISPEQIAETGAPALVLGSCIFLGPFLIGAVLVPVLYPALSFSTAMFVSLTLSITALPVMGIMLGQFGLGKSRLGVLLMNTAVVNELAAVTVFSVLLRVGSGGGLTASAIAVLSVAVFLGAILSVHMFLRLLRASRSWTAIRGGFRRALRSKEAGFALLMVMALGSALLSQFLGLTFLLGAFYAGLLVTPRSAGREEHRAITHVFDSMTWGFFVPLFFAFVGLSMDLRSLAENGWVVFTFVVLVGFAILSKLLLGYGTARALGWGATPATAIGFLVSSRGAVELAMAVILLQVGIFSASLYTLVAAVGLVTTILAPIGAARYGGLSGARGPASVRAAGFGRPLEPAQLGAPGADPESARLTVRIPERPGAALGPSEPSPPL